jgi:hypothetical protein
MTTPKFIQPVQDTAPETSMSIEPTASLDEAIQGALGRKLRESWDEVVREEVPTAFKDLLDKLKHSESSSGQSMPDRVEPNTGDGER